MIERGANHEVVESVRLNTAGTALVTNRYTVIGNGLNYQDASGNWLQSEPVVKKFPGGVVCAGASYEAILGTNLNMAGAVDLLTSDQMRIVSRPIGIAFFDPVSGKRVLLAKVKDCPPQLISSNEIAYADAFDGNGIQAAVVYKYDVGRFSQDVKFLAPLAVRPADFGLSSRTRLEILTAIEQCPTPTITSHVLERETNATLRATMAQPDLVDQMLDFGGKGGMQMPLGHAFPQEQPVTPSGPPRGVPVAKQLVTIDGQSVLAEDIPWGKVASQLDKLPQQSARANSPAQPSGLKLEWATSEPAHASLPSFASRLAQIRRGHSVLLASAAVNPRPSALNANGFVMDYTLVQSGGPITFESGQTYLVTGQAYVSGVTFQAGAVIKYQAAFDSLIVEGNPYAFYYGSPVIFTSMNDNSVGAIIDGSNGDPGSSANAGWELVLEYLTSGASMGPVDFRYANGGIDVEASAGATLTLDSASFTDIYEGIAAGQVDSVTVNSANVCFPDYPSWGTQLWAESAPGQISVGTVTTCVNDFDGNGLPDAWEYKYFGVIGNDPNADPDGDGLNNLQEYQDGTDPTKADTDSDGLADGLEAQLGTDPNNAYSQDSTHTYKDGQWYLTAETGQTGTREQISIDVPDTETYGGLQPDGITVIFFDISGPAPWSQYNIYIQTPSVDPSDNSQVWQDMGIYDWSPDGGGGEIVYAGWPGDVPYDGSVRFAALDSQDRDSDGLQDGYEIMATHTIVGAYSSQNDGIADGDATPENDGISNARKWQYGLNPLAPVSDTDADGNGLPDWLDNYITIWWGSSADTPWGDPDSDDLPNIVEYEIGTDPTVPDYYGALPPPNGVSDVADQYVSLQRTASYDASQGPDNNPYFPDSGVTAGPLGECCAMVVQTSSDRTGAGTATLDFEVLPLNQASTANDVYSFYAPFAANPGSAEFQEPDPADGLSYRHILLDAPHIADDIWHAIDDSVLESLHADTLLYLHETALLRIHLKFRQIQYLKYEESQIGTQAGIEAQIAECENTIQAEMTVMTAVDGQLIKLDEGARWVSWGLRGGGFLACAVSWYEDYPTFIQDYWEPYLAARRNHDDYGAAAPQLSSYLQTMLQEIPGIPDLIVGELDPSNPIFWPNPLGWYDGGSGL